VLAPTLTKGKTIYVMKIKKLLLYLTMDIAKRNCNGCTCTHSDKRSNDLSHENQTIAVVVEKGSGEAHLQCLCTCTHTDKWSNNLIHEKQTIVVVFDKGSGEAQLQRLHLRPIWQKVKQYKS
jgi:hypothetical protein